MQKRFISTLLALCIVLSLLPVTAFAEAAASGECGEEGSHIVWEWDGTDTLTISGTGTIGSVRNIPCISNVHNVIIENGVTGIGDFAFNECSELTNIRFPNSLTTIGANAFNTCWNLTDVTFPDSVTSIGDSAFLFCHGLTSITIPDGMTSIGSGVFEYCENLSSVTIPNGVTSIGDSAFRGCMALTNISLPDSLTTIECSAFDMCYSLTDISIPESVTKIGYSAFLYCESLTNLTIPKGLTCMEASVFYGCKNLTNVTLPESVTKIDTHAFGGCSGLKSITIPKSTAEISAAVFYDCNQLTDIYYGGSEKQWRKISSAAMVPDCATIHCALPDTSVVTYDANGGSGEMADEKIEDGQTLTLPSCGFTAPENQKFKTWRIYQTEYAPGDHYLVTSDTTVTAVWASSEKIPDPAAPEEIRDKLDELLSGPADKIRDVLEALDKGKIKDAIEVLGDGIFDRIQELEDRIGGSAEIDVSAGLGFVEADVKIAGAKLSADYKTHIRLEIRPPEDSGIVIPDQTQKNTFRFSMKLLEGAHNNIVELQVPTRITLPIPGITARPKNFVIWHKHGSELAPVTITTQPFRQNGQWYVSFMVSGFSDFIMSYEEETANSGTNGGHSKPSIKSGEKSAVPGTTAPGGGIAGFHDVAPGAWYADSVKYVVEKGLFDGVGNNRFAPEANMTRAMMWTVLARYQGVDTTGGANWYEAARTWAMAQGVSDGTMADANVTREQFVTMLWRLSGEPASENAASFTDSGKVSDYARTAVDWAVSEGIVNGYGDGSFRPQGSATRAEVAKMLTIFVQNEETAA